jgi:hypothetical protein
MNDDTIFKHDAREDVKNDYKNRLNSVPTGEMESAGISVLNKNSIEIVDSYRSNADVLKDILNKQLNTFSYKILDVNTIIGSILAEYKFEYLSNDIDQNGKELIKLRENQLNKIGEHYVTILKELIVSVSKTLNIPREFSLNEIINIFDNLLTDLGAIDFSSSNSKLKELQEKHISEMKNLLETQLEDLTKKMKTNSS